MAFGVTSTGFVLKTQQDIFDELVVRLRARFGDAFDTSADSVAGNYTGIISAVAAELWEVAAAVYRSQYPSSAVDEALDNVCDLVGVRRLTPLPSLVPLLLNLDSGVTALTGSIVSIGDAGAQFETLADAVNAAGEQRLIAVEAQSSDTGPVVANAGSLDTIKTPVVGWVAKAAGVNSTLGTFDLDDLDEFQIEADDGTLQTVVVTTGDFVDIDLATAAEVVAVILANTTGLSMFVRSDGFIHYESDTDGPGSAIKVVGGDVATKCGFPLERFAGMNRNDAELGRDLETDPDLRVRRSQSLQIVGSGTPGAIRARLLNDVAGVTAVFVFQNRNDEVDSFGRPGHSVEAVVQGGTDQDIADLLWDIGGAGIELFGSVSVGVVDDNGDAQTVFFSRPVPVPIAVEVDVETDSSYAVDGDDQVKAAIVLFGDALGIGTDVFISALYCAIFAVAGVVNVTRIEIGTPGPAVGSADIVIDPDGVSTWDTSDIVVAAVAV